MVNLCAEAMLPHSVYKSLAYKDADELIRDFFRILPYDRGSADNLGSHDVLQLRTADYHRKFTVIAHHCGQHASIPSLNPSSKTAMFGLRLPYSAHAPSHLSSSDAHTLSTQSD